MTHWKRALRYARTQGHFDSAPDLRRHHWRAASCHLLPWPINLLVFDAALVHNTTLAVQLLQISLGVKVDGINGPRTR